MYLIDNRIARMNDYHSDINYLYLLPLNLNGDSDSTLSSKNLKRNRYSSLKRSKTKRFKSVLPSSSSTVRFSIDLTGYDVNLTVEYLTDHLHSSEISSTLFHRLNIGDCEQHSTPDDLAPFSFQLKIFFV